MQPSPSVFPDAPIGAKPNNLKIVFHYIIIAIFNVQSKREIYYYSKVEVIVRKYRQLPFNWVFYAIALLVGLASLPVQSAFGSDIPPACPDGTCPGLGNAFYLPSQNTESVQTGGTILFKDTKIGTCAKISPAAQNPRRFSSSDSMEHFVETTSSAADVSGSYSSKALSAKGSVSTITGYNSDITTTFHSKQLIVRAITSVIDLQKSSTCMGVHNIDPKYLKAFESLAAINRKKVSAPASWAPYVEFLKSQGSHIIMQQQIGSSFQHWESSTSAAKDIANSLEAKACAEVEGTSGDSGWSVNGCAAYTKEEKEQSLKTESNGYDMIRGGTAMTRQALQKDFTKKNLDAFIDSSAKGDQVVQAQFTPVWEALSQIYTPLCKKQKQGSKACQNLQRAVNLQAAYEGWTAVGCEEKTAGEGDNKITYQRMAVAGTTSLGIATYKCAAKKTGCYSGKTDCHIGGLIGSQCYCYGPTCLQKGAAIAGTDLFRSDVQGSQSGGTNDDVNQSCKYQIGVYCDCDYGWSDGLPDRNLYLQSAGN